VFPRNIERCVHNGWLPLLRTSLFPFGKGNRATALRHGLTPDAKRRPAYRKRHRQLKLMAVYFETVDFEMDGFVAR
jgi:hypothetical protein